METRYIDILLLLAPETILVIAALAALAADLFWMRGQTARRRRALAFGLSAFGCLAAVLSIGIGPPDAGALSHWLHFGPATGLVKTALIGLTLGALAMSARSSFTDHLGELHFIALVALAGMMLMVSAEHLLLAFAALETVALSFYSLVALRKQSRQTAEGALKYFLLGGVSAAFTLFGISFIYGATHALTISEIAAQSISNAASPLMGIGMIAVAVGFGFKIAAAPMHWWAPDVYQTAAPPIASLIASASKLAGFYLFARIWTVGLAPWIGFGDNAAGAVGWLPLLALLALASLLIGNLAAIAQSSVKRLLAYSAIAHSGYVLLGIMANNPHGTASMIYYLLTYGLAVLGAFALVMLVEKTCGDDRIASFANFHQRFPVEAFCLLIFILSLAGIPPLAGFFGKFYLFAAALQSPHAAQWMFWLVAAGIAASVLSLYYYLRILKQAYTAGGDAIDGNARPDPVLRTIAILAAGGVVLFGCFPELIIQNLPEAFRSASP